MNELERTALNEVLRTVRLINEKVAEIGELQSQQELAISYLLIIDIIECKGSFSTTLRHFEVFKA